MELETLPETLAYICKRLDKVDDLHKMLGTMHKVVDQVVSLKEEICTIKKDLVAHRAELYQCIGKQTELEYDINQLRKVTQTTAKDCELAERLEIYIKDICETLEYHQHFIEQVDNHTRRKNLIFHGIPECKSAELGANDVEKVKTVIKETGHSDIGNFTTMRLGQNADQQDKHRPILVKVDNHETQKTLLMKAKQLRYKTGFSRIYIKKDLHYTVRREISRLKKREMEEKNDPGNIDADIKMDWKDRILKVNGMYIDRFKPSF